MSNLYHLDWGKRPDAPSPPSPETRGSVNGPYWDKRIETLPRADLEAYQTRQLAAVLSLAYYKADYYRTAFNTAKVKPGSSVVVFGCGGVGISAIQGAHVAGAAIIVAVDLVDEKLETAKTFGATHACKPDDLAALQALSLIHISEPTRPY